jgi:exosome complex RNA-binding protein Rrp4
MRTLIVLMLLIFQVHADFKDERREQMGEASYAVYQFADRLSQKFVRFKSIYNPTIEEVVIGDLVFNLTLSYKIDMSRKKFNTMLTFNQIHRRRG